MRDLARCARATACLEVMLTIAESEDGLVTQSELARSLGVSVSNVQAPVRSLLDCGALTALPQGDGRSKFLLMNPSAAWDWAIELAAQVQGAEPIAAVDH